MSESEEKSYLAIKESEIIEAVGDAFRNWYKDDLQYSPLLPLRIVQRAIPAQMGEASELGKKLAVKTVLQLIMDQLKEELKKPRNVIELVEKRYIEKLSLEKTSGLFFRSVPTVARNQNDAFKLVGERLIQLEEEAAEEIAQAQEQELPKPSYTKLFGVNEAVNTLCQRVLDDENYHLIALNGIGGIGKTSLAREVAREVIRTFHFKRVIWITISQDAQSMNRSVNALYKHFISQLAQALFPKMDGVPVEQQEALIWPVLKETPYLIVIDNLEVEEEVTELVEQLKGLVQPTKILFGSRARPSQPIVYCHDVTDIPRDDAYDFLRFLTKNGNVEHLEKKTFTQIYDVVGGNPLALQLVISLLRYYPLGEILPAIEQGSNDAVLGIYRRIYERLWVKLSGDSKKILMLFAMSEVNTAVDGEFLQAGVKLEDTSFWNAVRELRYNSLLNYHGASAERTYTIHRITETFVLRDVAQLF